MPWPFHKLLSKLGASLILVGPIGGCSTPSFDEVAGNRDHDKNEAIVEDVVQLVKCELADAFRDKVPGTNFKWMADWTVKSELTLQVSDNGGIAPSLGTAKFNGGRIVPEIGLAGGFNLSGQAQRVETIAFTLSLRELPGEVSQSFCEDLRSESEEHRARELRSGLKLREWVAAALRPVENSVLKAGFRPQPVLKLTAPVPPPTRLMPQSRVPIAADSAKYSYEGFREELEEMVGLATAIEKETGQAFADRCKVDEASVRIERNIEIAKAMLRGVTEQYPDDLLTEAGQHELESVQRELKAINRTKSEKRLRCERLPGLATAAGADVRAFKDTMNHSLYAAFKKKNYIRLINAESSYLGLANEYLKAASEQLTGRRLHFEPPMDSLSHHVQFVLAKGLGASLHWGLAAWPGPAGNLASLSRVRTHTLVLTVTPPGQQGRDEKSRLLATSALRGATAGIAGP